MGADHARGILDLLSTGARPPEKYVVPHGAREEKALLRDHHDRAPQIRNRDRTQVDPVQRDAARGRVVEPGDQPRHGGLARPGLPHQRDDLPRRDAQVDVVQHVGVAVRERHVLERDGTGGVAQGHRRSRLTHGRRFLQHAGQLLQRRAGGLEHVVELRQLLHRVEELAQIEDECGQHAERDLSLHDEVPAEQQN